MKKLAVVLVALVLISQCFTSYAITTEELESYVGKTVRIFSRRGTLGTIGKIVKIHNVEDKYGPGSTVNYTATYIEVVLEIMGPNITYIINVEDIIKIEVK